MQVKQARRNAVLAATGLALAALTLTATTDRTSAASTEAFGLTDGTPALKSAGALAFGPGSVLFVGDTASAIGPRHRRPGHGDRHEHGRDSRSRRSTRRSPRRSARPPMTS